MGGLEAPFMVLPLYFFSPLVFDDGLLSSVYPLNAQRSLLISILPTPSVHPLILSRRARASSSAARPLSFILLFSYYTFVCDIKAQISGLLMSQCFT